MHQIVLEDSVGRGDSGDMGKTVVMTLRLPAEVARGVERLANRFGHKPAQLGTRLVEEGLRRREHPQIDLRDTTAGRVAYLSGTRLAVYWVAQAVRNGISVEAFAREHDLPVDRVRAGLAYAEAFADEIAADLKEAESNRNWLRAQEASWRVDGKNRVAGSAGGRREAAR